MAHMERSVCHVSPPRSHCAVIPQGPPPHLQRIIPRQSIKSGHGRCTDPWVSDPPPFPPFKRTSLCPLKQGVCGKDAWEGGRAPPPPWRGPPSLRPATVPLTASANFHGICNRQ